MITIEKLLNMGLHLGHSSKQMNPKMRPYICGKKNELQLLDLIQSYWFLKRACHFLMLAASQKKTFLFVSKKKFLAKKMALSNLSNIQDISLHTPNLIQDASTLGVSNKQQNKGRKQKAEKELSSYERNGQRTLNQRFITSGDAKSRRVLERSALPPHVASSILSKDSRPISSSVLEHSQINNPKNVFYVNQRWLGGLLTNWHTVRKCLNKLETLEKYEQSGSLEKFSKKEVATWKRDFQKLQTNLGGLRGMTQLPDIVILLGQLEGGEAIRECKKLNIPTVQLLDTNSDPNLADLFVPFNDDCLTGLHFVVTAFLKAIKKGSSTLL